MVFFDLNIPLDTPGSKEEKGTRIKLVVKAMELGYSGIAYNRVLNGVMADTDRCTITPLPLESLLRSSPPLANTIRFHREVLSVPVGNPFRQYTRLTLVVDSMFQAAAINSGNPVIRSYDLLAVRPMTEGVFEHACKHLEVDLISIDLSQKQLFRLKIPVVKAAVERGIFFEITYSPAISNVHSRRETFANAKLLVQRTRGRNIIISSAAPSVCEFRGPNDVANMSTLFGLSLEHAKAAVSKNCRSVILHGLTRKKCYKAAIQVDNCPPNGIVGSDKAWFNVSEVWDPISSGEGLVLNDTQRKESKPAVDMRAITELKENLIISNANTVVGESMSKIHELDVAQGSSDYNSAADTFLLSGGSIADGYRMMAEQKSTTNESMIPQFPAINCDSYSQVKMLKSITHDETVIDTIKQTSNLASGSDVKMDGVESSEDDIHVTDLNTHGRILISDVDDARMEEKIATACGDVSAAVCDDHKLLMKIKSKTGRGRKLKRKRLDETYNSSLHEIQKPALFKRKVQSIKKKH